MTFNAPSFFAGIGTVLGLVVAGFGGGVLMSDVILDRSARTPSKIERQAAEQAKPPAPATPVPVTEPQSIPAPLPSTQPAAAPGPAAEPQPPPTPQPQTILAAPVPPLGPQQPVSLTNPAHEPKAANNEARQKKEEAKRAAREKKKAEERRIAEQRRQQQIREAEVKVTTQPQRAIDLDDEPDERPLLRPERDDSFRSPRFRLFGNDW